MLGEHSLVPVALDHLNKCPFVEARRLSLISLTALVSTASPANTIGTSFE